jgi:hypothetical protein
LRLVGSFYRINFWRSDMAEFLDFDGGAPGNEAGLAAVGGQ